MTNSTSPDLTLTGSLLVAQFNEMVATATDLGLTGYREVNRFATAAAGQERTRKLHTAIQAKLLENAGVTDPEVVETQSGLHPLDQGNQSHRVETKEETEFSENEVAALDTPPANSGDGEPEEDEPDLERLPDEAEEAYMARKAAAKKSRSKKKGVKTAPRKSTGVAKTKSTDGTTIREKTDEYNRLVPQAKKAGITWAKHHTSNFESQVKADVALKKLKDAIKKA